MTERWVSQAKHWCKVCNCWMDGKESAIRRHNNGAKHKANADKQMKEQRKAKFQARKEDREIQKQLKAIERAAVAGYRQHDLGQGNVGGKADRAALVRQQLAELAYDRVGQQLKRQQQQQEQQAAVAQVGSDGGTYYWDAARQWYYFVNPATQQTEYCDQATNVRLTQEFYAQQQQKQQQQPAVANGADGAASAADTNRQQNKNENNEKKQKKQKNQRPEDEAPVLGQWTTLSKKDKKLLAKAERTEEEQAKLDAERIRVRAKSALRGSAGTLGGDSDSDDAADYGYTIPDASNDNKKQRKNQKANVGSIEIELAKNDSEPIKTEEDKAADAEKAVKVAFKLAVGKNKKKRKRNATFSLRKRNKTADLSAENSA
eukprot:TRINITY_DN65846_c9_g1_i1.p1 TRINITY_DN65846_c9_g1~~TRINITY_DN65846_c9_g1_i1.p1  ORF type:complete len:374 (-),score=187.10 TRINITY_DN65846_c9_g1_i1:104-1225(-)